jgi:hypothetical protein
VVDKQTHKKRKKERKKEKIPGSGTIEFQF